MPIQRRNLVQARRRQAGDHRPDVREWHELILPDRDRGGRNEDARGIHAMQIDRFREAKKRLWPVAARVVTTARQQIALDRKDKALVLPRGVAAEAGRELLRAAVS